MLELEVLYKPFTEAKKVEVFGRQYAGFIKSPNVYIVKKIDEKDRTSSLSFFEKRDDELKIHHLLHDCVYDDVDGNVHINCRLQSEEYIENEN